MISFRSLVLNKVGIRRPIPKIRTIQFFPATSRGFTEKKTVGKMGGSPWLRPPKTAPGKISKDQKKKIMFKPPPKQSPISTTQKAYGEAFAPPKKSRTYQKHMWWSKKRLYIYLFVYIVKYIYIYQIYTSIYLLKNKYLPSKYTWLIYTYFDKTTYKTADFLGENLVGFSPGTPPHLTKTPLMHPEVNETHPKPPPNWWPLRESIGQ